MTHPYFVAKAREVFARAGGDPEKSSALAAWAEDARARMDSKHGVLVAEDGTLVARTVWVYSPVRTSYCVAELLVDLGHDVRRDVGLTTGRRNGYTVDGALGILRRAMGQPIIEVRYWEACTGAGAHVKEV